MEQKIVMLHQREKGASNMDMISKHANQKGSSYIINQKNAGNALVSSWQQIPPWSATSWMCFLFWKGEPRSWAFRMLEAWNDQETSTVAAIALITNAWWLKISLYSPLQPKIRKCWRSYDDCLALEWISKKTGLANTSTECNSVRQTLDPLTRYLGPAFGATEKRYGNLTFHTGQVPSLVKTCATKTWEKTREGAKPTVSNFHRTRRGCRAKIFITPEYLCGSQPLVHGTMWVRGACLWSRYSFRKPAMRLIDCSRPPQPCLPERFPEAVSMSGLEPWEPGETALLKVVQWGGQKTSELGWKSCFNLCGKWSTLKPEILGIHPKESCRIDWLRMFLCIGLYSPFPSLWVMLWHVWACFLLTWPPQLQTSPELKLWGSQHLSLETKTRRSTTSCAKGKESQPSIKQNAWTKFPGGCSSNESRQPCPERSTKDTTVVAQGVQKLSLCLWAHTKHFAYPAVNIQNDVDNPWFLGKWWTCHRIWVARHGQFQMPCMYGCIPVYIYNYIYIYIFYWYIHTNSYCTTIYYTN